MPDFDAIIIGTGQAGPSLAFRLAGAGMKVVVVERHLVGGNCVNTGCTPTKALVASSYAARIAWRAAEYGVVIGGDVGVDVRQVKARKDAEAAAARVPALSTEIVKQPRHEGLRRPAAALCGPSCCAAA
jgi:pyruvate/2-oxoglutarate dehydrogenase complex dihydrolipoamide dehydrogenase (E3) component